jgi:hypothetical protein
MQHPKVKKDAYNVSAEGLTAFQVPYRNNKVHDKNILCSQKLDTEIFKDSLTAVCEKLEECTTMVSTQQSVLNSMIQHLEI